MALALTFSPAADLERVGDEIAELSAHLDAATAHLLALLRNFDARKGWSGFHSCAHWLSYRTGLELGAAREKARVARALGTLPTLAGALTRGELSYSKVRAWRWVDRREGARESDRRHRARGLTVTQGGDGMVWTAGGSSPRWEPCSSAPSRPRARRSTSAPGGRRRTRAIPRRTSRPCPSARPTPWPWSPRWRCAMSSIRGRRANAIRWWSTSTRPCSPTPRRPASPSSRAARAFQLKRLGASPVTRAGWSLAHDPEDPVGALRTRHRAEELTLDARTARPLWYGERLDLGYAIDVLRPPPAPPPTTPAQDG